MWGYIRKIIQFIIFSFLLAGAVTVGCLTTDGMIQDSWSRLIRMVACIAVGVMTSLGVLSLLGIQRRRNRSSYEKDPISVVALAILIVMMIAAVVGAAIGAVFLVNYLYGAI